MRSFDFRRQGPRLVALTLGGGLAVAPVAAQTSAPSVELGGRVQVQFNTSSRPGVAPTEWLLRRVRLEARVAPAPTVRGKVQVDFAPGQRVDVKDAYLQLLLAPGVSLLAGKANRPFSPQQITSSVRMLPVERGLRIRGLDAWDEQALLEALGHGDRDVGVQLALEATRAPVRPRLVLAWLAGPLAGQTGDRATAQWGARLEAWPTPALRLGVAASRRDYAQRDSAGAVRALRAGTAWLVDAEWSRYAPGLHVVAEALLRAPVDPFRRLDGRGASLWLGYRTRPLAAGLHALEPTFRLSTARLDGALRPRGGTLLTPGLNLYATELNRVLLGLDLWRGADGVRATSFKAMFQLAF